MVLSLRSVMSCPPTAPLLYDNMTETDRELPPAEMPSTWTGLTLEFLLARTHSVKSASVLSEGGGPVTKLPFTRPHLICATVGTTFQHMSIPNCP